MSLARQVSNVVINLFVMSRGHFLFVKIALSIIVTSQIVSVAHAAEQDITCSPDNEMRSDREFSKIYEGWKTTLAKVVGESVRKNNPRVYWGRTFAFPGKMLALFWVDGLDPFSVVVVKNNRRMLINASSVTSQRENKPKVDKVAKGEPKKPSKANQKIPVEQVNEEEGRTDLHIETQMINTNRNLTLCSYEIRGSYIFIKLYQESSSNSSEL